MAGYTIPTDNGLGATTPSRLKLNTHQNPIKKADPYPGLDEATKLKITQEVNANYTSDVDRNIAANKLYKQYLTEATNKQLMADRQQARLELTAGSITAKNPIEKQKLNTIGTMSDMANVIRDAYMKDGVDLTQKSDQDILTKFATNNPELSAGMEDIINNNGDAIEWAKSVGLKERTGWDKVKDLVGSVAETIRKGGEGMESLIDKANNFLGADNERQSASFRNYMESKYSYADMWNMSKEQKDAEYQYYLDHKKELERSTAQDILDFAVGATDLAFWETAPLLTAGFTLAGNAEQLTENTMLEGVGEKVTGTTEWLGEKTSVLGELAGYLPGLSQFKNSLDEQGQQEFDAYVGNLATMLVLHYGPKMARNGYNKFVNKSKKLNITSEGAKINPEGPTGPKGPTEGGPTDITTENIKSTVASELKPNEQAIIDAFKKFKETGAGADTIADKVLLFGKDAKGSIESAIKPALRVTKGAKENARVTERLDTMTRDLVKKGYKWETITEYKNAVMTEMGKMWGKVEGAVKDNAGLSISTEQLVNTCREYAAELRKTGKMDAVKAAEKMEQQASIWEEMGEISMDALEKLKQDNNSDANYRNSESSHYDDNLMKKINKNVGKMQEEILAKAESNTTLTPEEFSELKRMRGTYADLLGDINKAEIRQMRKTTSLGDQLNTVQSFGDAIGSSNNMIGAVWNGVKRVGKKVVNDAYERTRDADFLARRAWEKYNEEINGKSLDKQANSEYNTSNLDSNKINNDTRIKTEDSSSMTGEPNGRLAENSREEMNKSGKSDGGVGTSTKPIRQISDGNEMQKLSQDLQSKAERGLFMDIHSPEEYGTFKNFTNENAAISVKPDGDIINFISDGTKGAGKELMFKAIEEGGTKMDNYGEGLVSYYENFGFEPVARIKFNPEFAPEGWDFEKRGQPDIYAMKHNGDKIGTVKESFGKYTHKTIKELNELPELDYDEALSYRDWNMKQSKNSAKDVETFREQQKLKTEDDVFEYSQKHKEEIYDAYLKDKGNYINPDDFRPYINFGGELEAAITHKGASALADELFNRLLGEAKKGSKGVVVAGGPGSGKGYSANVLGIKPENYKLFVDKTKGNKELYKMLDKGMDVDYYVVIPDIDKVVGQITGRAIHQGRTLPINSRGLPTHKEVTKVVNEILSKEDLGGNFRFHFVTNPGKGGVTKELGMQDGMKLFKEYSNKIDERTPERVEKTVREFRDEKGVGASERQIKELITSMGGILGIYSLLGYSLDGEEK